MLLSTCKIFLVNAVTFRREFSILPLRVAILILLYFFMVSLLTDIEIGIFGGLFHFTPIGSLLAVFHARRIVQPIFPYNRFEPGRGLGLFSKGYVKACLNAVMLIVAILFLCLLCLLCSKDFAGPTCAENITIMSLGLSGKFDKSNSITGDSNVYFNDAKAQRAEISKEISQKSGVYC